MATLDDILTTQKNGVVAINNLNQTLLSVYNNLNYVSGTTTSNGINANTAVATSGGRLARMSVITAGSSAGTIYNYATTNILTYSSTGTVVTINFTNPVSFTIGDVVFISNAIPSSLNGTFTLTGVTSTSISFNNAIAATGATSTPGSVFKVAPSNAICAIPTDVGSFEIGANFSNGLFVVVGTGQVLTVTYSLD